MPTRGFLRFVTNVAIGGVAVGVAALLIALSVVRGFSREIERKLVGFGSHIQVESMRDAPLDDSANLVSTVAAISNVEVVHPVVQEFSLLRRGRGHIDGVLLTGVEELPGFLQERLVAGSDALSGGESRSVVVGATLARVLGLGLGDNVTAVSLRGGGSSGSLVGSRPRVRQFIVSGIYETSLADFDELNVYTDIDQARDLLGYDRQQVSRLDVSVDSLDLVATTARTIEERLGFPVQARSIYEVFRSLFAWVRLQQTIIPVPIGIIVVVASFNILGALLMLILEKSRQIGIFVAMGASKRQVRDLFVRLGLIIGGVGSGIGVTLALTFGLLQQRYGIIRLPAEAYYMDRAPIDLNLFDFLIVVAVAIILSGLAAYLPARQASNVQPVQVIRFR
jgi:lipoprotein-releasing system permease protein